MNRFQVKVGEHELSIESSGTLTEEALAKAFVAFERFRELVGSRPSRPEGAREAGTLNSADQSPGLDVSINMFTSRLGSDSCRAILNAAAAHLSLVDGKNTFTKDEWFKRAQEAHEWQRDFVNQRARDARRMVSSKEIIEKNGGAFAVPAKILDAVREKLAEP